MMIGSTRLPIPVFGFVVLFLTPFEEGFGRIGSEASAEEGEGDPSAGVSRAASKE